MSTRSSIRQSRSRIRRGIISHKDKLEDEVVKTRNMIKQLKDDIEHADIEKSQQKEVIDSLERQEQLIAENIKKEATNLQDLRNKLEKMDHNETSEYRERIRGLHQKMDLETYAKIRNATRPKEKEIAEQKSKLSKLLAKRETIQNEREKMKKDLEELISARNLAATQVIELNVGRGKRQRKSRKRGKKGGAWTAKYKRSINCNRPRGFSQKQYCKYGK
jgi:DNA repair exonuclease SbcCD ATPase subunit